MDIAGRTALVTGGAHRVGGALSRALAAAGARVVINYHQSEAAAARLVAEIEAAGGRGLAVRADISRPEAVRALIDASLAEYGRLDILINSASRFDRVPFDQITPEQWDRTLAVNLRAPFLLSRRPHPRCGPHAAPSSTCWTSPPSSRPSFVPHSVSKAGLAHLTRCLARALAPEVRVNAIAPGTVLPPQGFDQQDYAGGQDRRLLEQPGTPADVVGAVEYLIGADFVTGQTLVVDGGRMLL
jgi:pteridine reductase